jgi:hypothetical protein
MTLAAWPILVLLSTNKRTIDRCATVSDSIKLNRLLAGGVTRHLREGVGNSLCFRRFLHHEMRLQELHKLLKIVVIWRG